MGEKTDVVLGDNAERLRIFMKALLQDVHALEEMLASGQIESGIRRIGAEQELALVDASTWHPAPRSQAILDEIDDSHFTTELGKFNIECNLDPLVFGGSCLTVMQQQLDAFLAQAREARLVVCGFFVHRLEMRNRQGRGARGRQRLARTLAGAQA